MAITYGASPGTIITSALVTETLGSQTGVSADNVKLATAAVTPSTHSGYGGNVGDGSESFGPGDSYVGRLIAIRVGTATEEIKMCIAEADFGATINLQVHEDWDTQPASGDVLHVAYTGDDVNNGGQGGGVAFGNKTASWDFSNKFTIGNGTAFAFFMLGPSESMEINDSAGTTDPDFEIKNNGMFASGYTFGGRSVNGGYISTEQNGNGEQIWNQENGSYLRLHATDWKVNLNDLKIVFVAGADIIVRGTKNFQFTYDCDLLDGDYQDIEWIAGLAAGNAFVRISDATIINNWILISAAGFHTEASDTTTEILEVRNTTFIDTKPLVTVNSNKTWNFVNPIWDPSLVSQADFDFLSGTGNTVNWKVSINIVAQEPDGTKLQNAMLIVYENTQLADLVIEQATDTDGGAAGDFLYKNIDAADATSALTVTTYGGHALRVFKWLYQPFIGAMASDAPFDGTITLIDDTDIVQTTQATAKSAGSGVVWSEDANPSEIFDFTSGSGTALAGMILTFSPSGAIGTITEIADGDSAAGTIHLKTRNGTAIANGDTFSRTGGTAGTFSGTYTNDSKQPFSIYIDANSISLQALYDYYAAIMSETTLTAAAEIAHEWGRDQQAKPIYAGATGFYTDRSYGKGIFLLNFGAGALAYVTDDAGNTWVPPVSVTHTLNGIAENSEVTYTEKPTASDTGVDGSSTANSRDFVTTNAWTTDEHQGRLLVIESGADAGRYYIVSNTATTLKLDTKLSATAGSLSYNIYAAFDVLSHTENVPANGINEYSYVHTADFNVDILIFHVDYEPVELIDVLLGNSNQTIPVAQIPDVTYFNPP